MLVPQEGCLKKKFNETPVALCILGSTGSIGNSALEFIRRHRSLFKIVGLAAGRRVKELAAQIREFEPAFAVIGDPSCWSKLREELPDCPAGTTLLAGEEGLEQLASATEIDLVLASITGMAGLKPVITAVKAGKRIALANKESLVAAGQLVKDLQQETGAVIVPVDSEHSAIFQALQGQAVEDLEKIILTASGGPFLKVPQENFSGITPEQALRHPRWKMGPKITIDSATMVNKALEVIEAHWLFEMDVNRIEVLVHPQSIVHSLVSFVDGSNIAQLSHPDMKGPIAYALLYPQGRLPDVVKHLNLAELGKLEFETLDNHKFPAVSLARQAVKAGGAAAAVLNIANEFAVAAFLKGRYSFTRIVPAVAEMLDVFSGWQYSCVDDLIALQDEVLVKMDLQE